MVQVGHFLVEIQDQVWELGFYGGGGGSTGFAQGGTGASTNGGTVTSPTAGTLGSGGRERGLLYHQSLGTSSPGAAGGNGLIQIDYFSVTYNF